MPELELQLPELPVPQVFFIASLSNGETIVEGKGYFAWIPGDKTPWNRLIRFTAENDLTITSVSLCTPDGVTFTLPPISNKPRFRGYQNRTPEEKPIDYDVKRFIARDINGSTDGKTAEVTGVDIAEHYTILEAIYKDFTLQVWVDELNTRHSWVVFNKVK